MSEKRDMIADVMLREQWAEATTDTLDQLRGVGNVVCTIEEWNALHAELAAARAKIAALEARG